VQIIILLKLAESSQMIDGINLDINTFAKVSLDKNMIKYNGENYIKHCFED
jgi:hypothetical protein